MIYLDNSATTRVKPLPVKLAVLKALHFSANPTRSSHRASLTMALAVNDARENIKKFFNAPKNSDVVFTYNCTEALNYAILGTIKQNGHIICTAFEHNSVLRPLFYAQEKHNITLTIVEPNKNGIIEPEKIINSVTSKTYLIVVNQTSNVTGTTTAINEIGKFCKLNNILFLVDCAQSAGHETINMQQSNINMLAVAGHKGLLATQGIGALVVNNVNLVPIKFGGSGSNSTLKNMPNYLPDKLEAGTINTVGIMALNAGIKYVSKHQNKINNKISNLSKMLISYLKSNNQITLYSTNYKSGVISFALKNVDVNETQNILNEQFNICVRSGLHCAPLIHKFFKTDKTGLLRVSISYFNCEKDIKKLIKALIKITNKK